MNLISVFDLGIGFCQCLIWIWILCLTLDSVFDMDLEKCAGLIQPTE